MCPTLESYERPHYISKLQIFRGVAQPGSALASGARGRRFESGHPDWVTVKNIQMEYMGKHRSFFKEGLYYKMKESRARPDRSFNDLLPF